MINTIYYDIEHSAISYVGLVRGSGTSCQLPWVNFGQFRQLLRAFCSVRDWSCNAEWLLLSGAGYKVLLTYITY